MSEGQRVEQLKALLAEALDAWGQYEQAAHDDGRCIGYGFCMSQPCTQADPRIAEIRREACLPTVDTPTDNQP